jgi:hypothetical protein
MDSGDLRADGLRRHRRPMRTMLDEDEELL